ncbi:MAG: enoyl-CoA hydratase-related protein [Desulfarculaceae bacterium]|jgi:enoyl-CoA hydratase/carnithine racemase
MAYKTIQITHKDSVGILALNRPSHRNALNHELAQEIYTGLLQLDQDPKVHVIILTSAVPGVFCAGGDLAEHAACGTDFYGHQEAFGLASLPWRLIPRMNKMVIAAVDGFVLAGGCGLAVACDLVVSSDRAVFGLVEINVGIFPAAVAPVVIRAVGVRKFLELATTGDQIDSQEALRIGLISRVVPQEELEQSAMALAQKLARKSPATLQASKSQVYALAQMDFDGAVALGRDLVATLAATPDGREGMAAFLEKRKPVWRS